MCAVKDDYEGSFYSTEASKIPLPKSVTRFRASLVLVLMPCLPLVVQGVRDLSSRSISHGAIELFLATYMASLGWMLYSSLMSRMKYKYVSRAYISALLMNDAYREEESQKAKVAASIRHEPNRRRNADAREVYEGKEWPTKAAAARALASQFHVTPKTAEKWISNWHKG